MDKNMKNGKTNIDWSKQSEERKGKGEKFKIERKWLRMLWPLKEYYLHIMYESMQHISFRVFCIEVRFQKEWKSDNEKNYIDYTLLEP